MGGALGRRPARARPTPGPRWPGSPATPRRSGSAPSSPRRRSACPAPLADQVAGVDQMSGGRVELGLGAGWYEDEHGAYASRSRRSASASTASRSSWRSSPGCGRRPAGETFEYDGEHYQVTDSPALPKPVQRPVARRSSSAAAGQRAPRRWPPASPPSSTSVRPTRRLRRPAGARRARPARRSIATRRR